MAPTIALNSKKTGDAISEDDDKTSNKGSEGSLSNTGNKTIKKGLRQHTMKQSKNLDRNKASYPLEEIKKIFDKV